MASVLIRHIAALLVLIWSIAAETPHDISPLQAQAPIRVPKAPGSFDYMLVDASLHRLLISHTGSHAFAIADANTGAIVRQLDLGGAPHGIAVDLRRDAYLIGTSGEPQVVVVDRRSLQIVARIRTPGPVDAIALDPKRGVLYADEDNGQSIWLIGPHGELAGTLATPQDSDKSEFDAAADRFYQNFTTIHALYVIAPDPLRVVARWSTLPATRPHGLALDDARRRAYVAGTNGALVALDLDSGARVSTVAIARDVDQIAFDAKRGRIYCASGDGLLSVVGVGDAGLTRLADIRVPSGAHTLALDPATGAVWISYGTERDDYIMKLVP